MFKLSGLSEKQTFEIVPKSTILLGYVGSISHGTHIPKTDPNCIDDIDILGIAIANDSHYYGLDIDPPFISKHGKKSSEQQEVQKDQWDCVVYEIRKAFKLLTMQNPNIMAILWLQDKDYIYVSETGRLILDNRNIFISKQAYHSFVGYAHSQLHRMSHFPDQKQAYMGEKRYELVQKHGYDTKNAAHLIRLLRMGIEYLGDGTLRVFREDAAELKDIKSGKWTMDQVTKEAERLFTLAQEAYVRSNLPAYPDQIKIDKLLTTILKKEIT
jgi:predicted nucleotidyltransferase